jgi:hypothetical protein
MLNARRRPEAGIVAQAEPSCRQPGASALPVMGISVGRLHLPQQAELVGRLQRHAGNAAVQGLLTGIASTPVQRSARGGASACGCSSCAHGLESEEAAPGTVREERVQRFIDGTAENPTDELPPGSRYAGMDADVLQMLGRTLKAKTYWHWVNTKPTNLGQALDRLGVGDINTLVQLKRRMSAKGLWGNVVTMRNVWTTSSLGIDYNGPSMQGAVDAEDSGFCKDTTIGEAYHSGNCWREVVDGGTPGLHFCTPNSIHIDPHQTSTGYQPGLQMGGGSIIRYRGNFCWYNLLDFVGHMMDVEGGRPVNVFHRYHQLGDRISRAQGRARSFADRSEEARNQIPVLEQLEQRRVALDDTLRTWATRGFEGTDASEETRRVIRELDDIEARLRRVEDTIRGIQESEVPNPTILYGP